MDGIDVNKMRDFNIALNQLRCADDVFTFYYDETNNIRRLTVSADGFNVKSPECFVLGGVAHRGPPRALDITALRSAVRMQPNARELKLTHLGKGDLLSLLASRKVETFLDWLADHGLLAHYSAVDPLYWSIVDIVDSILSHDSVAPMTMFGPLLKNALYSILLADTDDTAALFHDYGYPDIAEGVCVAFVEDLLQRLEDRSDLIAAMDYDLLRGFLRAGSSEETLPFLQGEAPQTLVGSFVIFYMNRFCLFKNATHRLDIEPYIQERLQGFTFVDDGRELRNYSFVNSKDEPGIQVSDALIGLIGKLFSFVARKDIATVSHARKALSAQQRRTLGKLNALLDRSQAETHALFEQSVSSDDLEAGRHFLDGR
ncbi:MAG: DUF3800 domain-containing protein [Rhodospirillaceae bacterium]